MLEEEGIEAKLTGEVAAVEGVVSAKNKGDDEVGEILWTKGEITWGK